MAPAPTPPDPRVRLPPKHYSYVLTLAFWWQRFCLASDGPDGGNIYESAAENDLADRRSERTGYQLLLVSSPPPLGAERQTKTALIAEGATGWRSKAAAAVGQRCFLPSEGFCGSAAAQS